MHLEALTGSGAKISLTHFGTQVVEKTKEIGWEFSGGLFETKHELEILDWALLLAICLHVGSMVFEDLHGILGDADFLGI